MREGGDGDLTVFLCPQGRRGRITSFFLLCRLGPSIYCSPPSKNQASPKKSLKVSNPQKIPILYFNLKEKTLDCLEITPKNSPVL